MEIIKVGNNHLQKKEDRCTHYKCTCPVCGTEFKFTSMEVTRPRCINPRPDQCSITCPIPDCKHLIRLSEKCVVKESRNTNY